MSKHCIRRWVQFGVLDLLVLTTIAAVVVALWRPPRIETYYEPLAEGTKPGQHWAGNGLRMKFRWCPPGEFKMGEESNQVNVKLTRGFWMGKYEVTQDEYNTVMEKNLSCFSAAGRGHCEVSELDTDTFPVEMVSWDDAMEFCRALTEQEQRAGRQLMGWTYTLPTEAQWEYACRAGTQTAYSFGDAESRLVVFAWYGANADYRTHEVGQKAPNPWGLHDMHGNVWEWCRDRYQHKLAGGVNPEVAARTSLRVNRGGGWFSGSGDCRSAADRVGSTPVSQSHICGFRVALVQSR